VFAPYTPDQMAPRRPIMNRLQSVPYLHQETLNWQEGCPCQGTGTQLEVKRSPGVESSYFYSVGDSTSRIYPVVQFNSLDGVNVNISHNGDHW